eukprot:5507745-Pleurochrysis_carterae.AAC.2
MHGRAGIAGRTGGTADGDGGELGAPRRGRGCSIGSTHPTVIEALRGGRRRWAPVAPQATAPNPIS